MAQRTDHARKLIERAVRSAERASRVSSRRAAPRRSLWRTACYPALRGLLYSLVGLGLLWQFGLDEDGRSTLWKRVTELPMTESGAGR